MRAVPVSWLLWILIIAILILPVLLRFYASDEPRNDEGDSEPALAT